MEPHRTVPFVVPLPLLGNVSPDPRKGAMAHNLVAIARRDLDLADWVFDMESSTVGRIGVISMERLVFEKTGLAPDPNELVAQYAISPGGYVELTRRSWTKSQQEFRESLAQLTEEELRSSQSTNTELSSSQRSESSRTDTLSLGYSTGGSFGIPKLSWNVNSSLNYTYQNARHSATQEAQKSARSSTSNAASRSREEHNLTFTLGRETGTEDQSVERYENPSLRQWVDLRLFKIFATWQVTHEIQESRLLLELVVPNPGERLRTAPELQEFDPEGVPAPDPNRPPPGAPAIPDWRVIVQTEVEYYTGDDYKWRRRVAVGRNPDPSKYRIASIAASGDDLRHIFVNGEPMPLVDPGANAHVNLLAGQSYVRVLVANWDDNAYPRGEDQWPDWYPHGFLTRRATIEFVFELRDEWIEEWKVAAMPAQLDAYRRRYEQARLQHQLEQDAATAGSSVPHAQRLRKEEREELFSGALRWLNTRQPAAPSVFDSADDVSHLFAAWPMFEWEGASVLLYPWWWDASQFAEDEIPRILKLIHPDLARESFLKASWARLLLPVRLGYELDFLLHIFPDDALTVRAVMERARSRAYRQLLKAGGEHMTPAHPLLSAEPVPNEVDAEEHPELDGYVVDALVTLMAEQGYFDHDGVLHGAEPWTIATWEETMPTDQAEAVIASSTDVADADQENATRAATAVLDSTDDDKLDDVSRFDFTQEGTEVEF